MKRTIITTLLLFLGISVYAQISDTSTIINIDGEKISKAEFLNMYQKNSASNQSKIDRNDLREYLDLFINYKLKLKEAKKLGLDTTKTFLEETNKYRQQLAEPYINDRTITDELIQEAYDREKEFVRASHVLITVPNNATPNDTLIAYKKAMMIRDKAIKGEDFSKLAIEYSDDPSAKGKQSSDGKTTSRGNGGDLGFFSSMTMIYPFENACYNMKKGDISMPIRTNFGYHIIKLTDRINAPFYSFDIKHIWINNENHSEQECKSLIDEAYSKINTLGFDSVAKAYSDDKYSANNSGWLKNQRPHQVPAEYISMLVNMKEKDLSKPFQTRFGWHIIKAINFYYLPSLENQKIEIENRISKDMRSYKTIESFAEKSKKEYGFKEDKTKLEPIIKVVTDSIFSGTWQKPKNFNGTKELFRIGDESFTQNDFIEELYTSQRKQTPEYLPTFLDKFYNSLVLGKVVEYANNKLEDKYPELKANIDEFRNGVLIFAITDKMVWTKSLIDSVGLESFYNKNKENYMWQKRADATVWSIDSTMDLKKVFKIIAKCNKKGLTNDQTKDKLIKKFNVTKDNERKTFNYIWRKFEKGDNKNVDNVIFNNNDIVLNDNSKNIIEIDKNKSFRNYIVVFNQFIAPQIKTLDECKGIATSDYQNYLESQWIKDLRAKYPYNVDYNVFDSIR